MPFENLRRRVTAGSRKAAEDATGEQHDTHQPVFYYEAIGLTMLPNVEPPEAKPQDVVLKELGLA